jgi:hypothetical protein
MVMNHYDSAFNRHPNPARDCTESVNWNLKGAQKSSKKAETCAATFAKPNRQPIKLYAFMP